MAKSVKGNGMTRMIAVVFVISFMISAFSVVIQGGVIENFDIIDNVDVVDNVDVSKMVGPIQVDSLVPIEEVESTIVERGQFWNEYSDGSIVDSIFPINYWNSIESAYLPIDTNIYRNMFGEYYWKNAKNTYDVYFKQYSEYERVSMVFYKNYGEVFTPSEISFGFNNVTWRNDTSVELVSDLTSSIGSVSGNIISYDSFDNCSEIYQITNNSLQTALLFSDIIEPIMNDVDSLVIEGIINKEVSMNIYVDGFLWNEVSEISGKVIDFGFDSDDILYSLDALTIFDSEMNMSNGTYVIDNLGGGDYTYKVVVPYSFVDSVTYPMVIDPTWWVTNTVMLIATNKDAMDSDTTHLHVSATDSRYDSTTVNANLYLNTNGSLINSKLDKSWNNVPGEGEVWNYQNYTDPTALTSPTLNWNGGIARSGNAIDYTAVTSAVNGNLYNDLVANGQGYYSGIYNTYLTGMASKMGSYAYTGATNPFGNGYGGSVQYNSVMGMTEQLVERHINYGSDNEIRFKSCISLFSDSDVGTDHRYATTPIEVPVMNPNSYGDFQLYMKGNDGVLYSLLRINARVPAHTLARVSYPAEYWVNSAYNTGIATPCYIYDGRGVLKNTVNIYGQTGEGKKHWPGAWYNNVDFKFNSQAFYVNITDINMITLTANVNIDMYSNVNVMQHTSFVITLPVGIHSIEELRVYFTQVDAGVHSGWSVSGYGLSVDDFSVKRSQDCYYGTGDVCYSDSLNISQSYIIEGSPTDSGFIYRWDYFTFDTIQPSLTDVKVQFYYYDGSWFLIPNSKLPLNSAGYDGDGNSVVVDLSGLSKTSYWKIRVKFTLSSTTNLTTPMIENWSFGLLKARLSGSTAVLMRDNILVEPRGIDYSGNGNIIIDVGDSSWIANPYMRMYYYNGASCPDINSNVWTTISSDVYRASMVPNGWAPIINADNIQISLGTPNNGLYHSYLWYPNVPSTLTNYWYKVVIRDVSWYDSVTMPTRVLFMTTSLVSTIVKNNAPVANAGSDRNVMGMQTINFDADIDNADGGSYGGVLCLDTCEWKFIGPFGFNQVFNNSVSSVADGVASLQFPRPGVYTATLTLVDVYGLVDVDTATITVDNVYPYAFYEIDGETEPYVIGVLKDYYFDATLSQDYDGFIVMYSWDWGDGTWTNATPANGGSYVMKSFTSAGTYDVTLTVIDDSTFETDVTKTVELVVGIPTAEIADSGGNIISGTVVDIALGERLTLSGGASTAGSGNIINYVWNWGDGIETEASTPLSSHVYTISGDYAVTLTIENTLHYFDDAFIYVNATEPQGDDGIGNATAFDSLGKNPRFEYSVNCSNTTEIDVTSSLRKDGFGGAWLEEHVFKESIYVNIIRVSGVFDGANLTGNETEEVNVKGRYFGEPISAENILFSSGAWSDMYIFVSKDGVWTLCNIVEPTGATVDAKSGEIDFTFDSDWDEIVILTNPGLGKALKYTFGSENYTPASIGLLGLVAVPMRKKGERDDD